MDMAVGDTLLIGEGTQLRLKHKSGHRARLAIDSSESVDLVKRGQQPPPKPRQMPRIQEQQRAPEAKAQQTRATVFRKPTLT